MRVRRWLAAACPVAVLVSGLGAAPASAMKAAEPTVDFEMPFPCNDTWTGSSRANHSPSALAIDFNKAGDLGSIMVAAAPGTVTRVADLGNKSYGRYIIVDHGDDYSTLYAHLKSQRVIAGQTVDQGTVLGLVGGTGNVTGPHLHFEERVASKDRRAYFHQAAFVMGATQTSTNCPDVPLNGDWTKGEQDDVGVFRRAKTGGRFRLRIEGKSPQVIAYGRNTDVPVTGDWDGDGTTDVGVRRPGLKSFLLRKANGSTTRIAFGKAKALPVTGDWDGDGKTDVGMWNPATAVFSLRPASGAVHKVTLGTAGSIPVTGDWDGDGTTDVGVFDPSTATFTLVSKPSYSTATKTVVFGSVGDLPVTGDWNGDGVTDIGTWAPATATYSLRVTPAKARAKASVTSIHFGAKR